MILPNPSGQSEAGLFEPSFSLRFFPGPKCSWKTEWMRTLLAGLRLPVSLQLLLSLLDPRELCCPCSSCCRCSCCCRALLTAFEFLVGAMESLLDIEMRLIIFLFGAGFTTSCKVLLTSERSRRCACMAVSDWVILCSHSFLSLWRLSVALAWSARATLAAEERSLSAIMRRSFWRLASNTLSASRGGPGG